MDEWGETALSSCRLLSSCIRLPFAGRDAQTICGESKDVVPADVPQAAPEMLPHTVIRKVEVKCLRCALSDPHSALWTARSDRVLLIAQQNKASSFSTKILPSIFVVSPRGYPHTSHFSRAVRKSALYDPTGRSVCNVSSHVRVMMSGNY